MRYKPLWTGYKYAENRFSSSLGKDNYSIKIYLVALTLSNKSLRQMSKEAKKGPSKALFYFPQEVKTGIAPTRLILDSDKTVPFKEGTSVTVNWEGKKVQAEILALDGKYSVICNYANFLARLSGQYSGTPLILAVLTGKPYSRGILLFG